MWAIWTWVLKAVDNIKAGGMIDELCLERRCLSCELADEFNSPGTQKASEGKVQ
jgi:hypothetical protein